MLGDLGIDRLESQKVNQESPNIVAISAYLSSYNLLFKVLEVLLGREHKYVVMVNVDVYSILE